MAINLGTTGSAWQHGAMTLGEWLESLRAHLDPSDPRLRLTPAEERALLEIARVAAHTSERIAAPLTTFLAGVAVADLPPADRAARLESLLAELERG